MHRIVRRHIGLLVACFVFIPGLVAHSQTPILEEPNYTPTLTFDTVSYTHLDVYKRQP